MLPEVKEVKEIMSLLNDLSLKKLIFLFQTQNLTTKAILFLAVIRFYLALKSSVMDINLFLSG